MSTTRERRIKFMKAANYDAFSNALEEVMRQFGFDWFTDEQIADLVSVEVSRQRRWVRNSVRNRNALKARERAA